MLNSVSLFKFIDATTGINELLLTRKVRMAFAADIHFYNVNVLRGARLKGFSARALNRYNLIFRMDVRFHKYHLTIFIAMLLYYILHFKSTDFTSYR